MKKNLKNRIIKLSIVVLILSIVLTIIVNVLPRPLLVTFFDVGEGEAALIQGGQGETVLIDGGPNQSIINLLSKKLPWGQTSLDLVILSHPHSDHLIGLLEVIKKYQVKRILMPDLIRSTGLFKEFQEVIKNKKINIIKPVDNKEYKIGEALTLKIISTGWLDKAEGDVNFASLVIKISHQQSDFLFMGDAPQEVEKILMADGSELVAEVIKIAHQGSQTSSSLEFLQKVKPQIAVISVGRNNSYGHPSSLVLKNLQKIKTLILRTDQMGEINITIDNNVLSLIKPWQINWLIIKDLIATRH